jgi:hypothetical protein
MPATSGTKEKSIKANVHSAVRMEILLSYLSATPEKSRSLFLRSILKIL